MRKPVKILTAPAAIAMMLAPVAAQADIRPAAAVPSEAAAGKALPDEHDYCADKKLEGKSAVERADEDCGIKSTYSWDGPTIFFSMMSSGLFAWSIIKLLDFGSDKAISGG